MMPDISQGLRNVRVTIPTAVKKGDNANLICNYDLEGDELYSIKWYKGKREFYRYTPRETPAMKTFPTTLGIEVEVNNFLIILNFILFSFFANYNMAIRKFPNIALAIMFINNIKHIRKMYI